jgi:hypothetical protein
MDPAIPFSLANFFKQSTFQQIDMSFFLFPEVVVDDPRLKKDYNRLKLVQAPLKEVDRVSKPDWNLFDRCIICFAQPTDLFGGGAHQLPNGKLVPVAVFDVESTFDLTCQEVGHTFGLRHELGAWFYTSFGAYTNEYGCPYSVMSAQKNLSFERGPDPRLPGVAGPTDPQRVIGPYLPTAHLYINQYKPVNPNGVFNHADTVTYLPASYEHTPAKVRLIARDAAIAAWPSRRTVLAVVPPVVAGGDTHFLELRRRDALYDGGIGNAVITILAANFFAGNAPVTDPSTLRIRYVGRIDIEGVEGDLDYHSFSGRFVVRVTGIDDDFGAVDLTVAGGNAWQNFSVIFDDPMSNRALVDTSRWTSAIVAPCPVYAKDDYSYRVHIFETFHVLRARSSGYEKPHYAWYLENVLLNSAASPIVLNVQCRDINGHELSPPAMHNVNCVFKVDGGKLEFYVAGALADITLAVRVVVNESSPEVMKNFYPEKSISTTVRAENLAVEWDGKYQADHKACWKTFSDVNTRFQEQERIGPRDPRRQIEVHELIRNLAERDHRSAYAAAAEVARMSGVPTEDVLEDAFRNVGN